MTSIFRAISDKQTRYLGIILIFLALPPVLDCIFGSSIFSSSFRPILIFCVLALGLHIISGLTGLLHLGLAGMMAIGAYSYAILTCDIYPFQAGFLLASCLTVIAGFAVGILLGIPVLRLRGDYLAIVTLAFGEIIQDLLRNLEVITKGTQGINPVPTPHIAAINIDGSTPFKWHYFLWLLVALLVMAVKNLEVSRYGRMWRSVRDDELASSCFGISAIKVKLLAFGMGSALAALAGALWASHLGSTGEPGNYDFQVSVLCLCILIVGGLGSLPAVLLGAVLIVGLNSVILVQISEALGRYGFASSQNVYLSPNNYKYALYGIVLIVLMRWRPQGLLGAGDRFERSGKEKNLSSETVS